MKANYFCEEHEYDITTVYVEGVDHFFIQRNQLCRRGVWGEVGWEKVTEVSVEQDGLQHLFTFWSDIPDEDLQSKIHFISF